MKRLDSSLLKVVVAVETGQESGDMIAELEVYENSNYQDLAFSALRKLGLRESERNFKLMKNEIKNKIETYVKQLSKHIKRLERQRNRSYMQAPLRGPTWLPIKNDPHTAIVGTFIPGQLSIIIQ